jgi:hypothetical protein
MFDPANLGRMVQHFENLRPPKSRRRELVEAVAGVLCLLALGAMGYAAIPGAAQ